MYINIKEGSHREVRQANGRMMLLCEVHQLMRKRWFLTCFCFLSCWPGSLARGVCCEGWSRERGLRQLGYLWFNWWVRWIQFAQDITREEGQIHPRYQLTRRENEPLNGRTVSVPHSLSRMKVRIYACLLVGGWSLTLAGMVTSYSITLMVDWSLPLPHDEVMKINIPPVVERNR